jgi:hypothetical protein
LAQQRGHCQGGRSYFHVWVPRWRVSCCGIR